MIISYRRDNLDKPQPWPVGLDEKPVAGYDDLTHWVVSSGLGDDDGAVLVGFGPVGEYRVVVMPEAAAADPTSAEGLAATFSKGDGFFEWAMPVNELTVREIG